MAWQVVVGWNETFIVPAISASELIEHFKALSPKEPAELAKFAVENDESWIPESFKQGVADIEAGQLVDLDTALKEPFR